MAENRVLIGLPERLDKAKKNIAKLTAERNFYRDELQEAHSWMLAQGWCDCEYLEGVGVKQCRFADALNDVV